MSSTTPYKYYAAEISYFSGKVRPALRFKDIPFEEIAPTPEIFQRVIIPRTGLAFIPVLETPAGEILQDTSFMLDELERLHPDPLLYPTTPVQRVVAYLLELYADEFGVLPAMHYRWSFPESEAKARRDFAAATGNGENSSAFADRMKGSLPMLGVTPESIPGIEAHLRDLLDGLSDLFDEQPYLLGTQMSLGDCGLMGPLYAHLYLDAVPGRLLRETAPRVCEWIERMNLPEPGKGELLADDALSPALRPILELIGADASSLFIDALAAVEDWAEANPSVREPPRAVGMHETSLRGARFQRYTSPYALWMIQRPLDAYRELERDERARVDLALAGTGLDQLLRLEPRVRVGKEGFKLVLESKA